MRTHGCTGLIHVTLINHRNKPKQTNKEIKRKQALRQPLACLWGETSGSFIKVMPNALVKHAAHTKEAITTICPDHLSYNLGCLYIVQRKFRSYQGMPTVTTAGSSSPFSHERPVCHLDTAGNTDKSMCDINDCNMMHFSISLPAFSLWGAIWNPFYQKIF